MRLWPDIDIFSIKILWKICVFYFTCISPYAPRLPELFVVKIVRIIFKFLQHSVTH